MKRTTFSPEKNGFRFGNTFTNKVEVKFFRINFETEGLCGGMAFSALDYYFANRSAPNVSSANSELSKYLLKRQIDSFKYKDSWRFYRWTRRSNSTIIPKTLKNEIPKVKKSIDQGKPVVLGLVGATKVKDIGNENHQVVCYGYNEKPKGIELFVYDPNCPPSRRFTGELILYPFTEKDSDAGTEIPGDSSEPIKTISSGFIRFKLERSAAGKSDKIWRGFFVQRYSPKDNPPQISNEDRNESGKTTRDHRSGQGRGNGNRSKAGTKVRDHRENSDTGPIVRDHRTGTSKGNDGPIVRDHRN